MTDAIVHVQTVNEFVPFDFPLNVPTYSPFK